MIIKSKIGCGIKSAYAVLCILSISGFVFGADVSVTKSGYLRWADSKTNLFDSQILGSTTTGDRMMILYAHKDEIIKFSIKCQERWTRPGAAVLFLQNGDWNTIYTMKVLGGQEKQFETKAPYEGLYYLQVAAGLTACNVRTSVSCSYEASETSPLGLYLRPQPMFFFVPSGVSEFSIVVTLAEPAKSTLKIFMPDGTEVENMATLKPGSNEIKLTTPAKMDGRIWSFSLDGPVNYSESGIYLKKVPPYIADAPEKLFLPCVETAVSQSDNGNKVIVRFNIRQQDLAKTEKCSVIFRDDANIVFTKNFTSIPQEVEFEIPDFDIPKLYMLETNVSDSNGIIVSFKQKMAISHHRFFHQIDRDMLHTLPDLNEQERGLKYLIFSRGEPGSIYPESIPLREEIIEKIEISAVRDEYEPFHFAVHALQDLNDVNFTISKLVQNDGNEIPIENIDLRVVKFWPQRVTLDNTARYHEIPELLEPVHPINISKGHVGLFYCIVRIPSGAKSGNYNAKIAINCNGQTSLPLSVTITVLPFELKTPTEIRWMLDTCFSQDRWTKENYSEERIRAELTAIRKYGINILGLWPQYKINRKGETLEIDFVNSDRMMRLYQEVGFLSPLITLDHGGLEEGIQSVDSNCISDDHQDYKPEAKRLYVDIMSKIFDHAKQNKWPELVYLTVDEPGSSGNAEDINKFIRTAKAVKAAGFKTLTTCGAWYVDQIDPYLDYRCFSNITYASFTSKEVTESLRKKTIEANDVFWFYGGGSYANDGVLHEGIIVANRYQNGLLMWRSGATGIYNWIGCWPMGDRGYIDDFDSWKDSCTYYPPKNEKEPLTPTLQMEGIREGVKDYKYLYTLSVLIKEKKESKSVNQVEIARKIEKDLGEMLDLLPWMHAIGEEYPPQTITNDMLQRCRTKVILWIEQLTDSRQN